jgi:hypothetical protein
VPVRLCVEGCRPHSHCHAMVQNVGPPMRVLAVRASVRSCACVVVRSCGRARVCMRMRVRMCASKRASDHACGHAYRHAYGVTAALCCLGCVPASVASYRCMLTTLSCCVCWCAVVWSRRALAADASVHAASSTSCTAATAGSAVAGACRPLSRGIAACSRRCDAVCVVAR